MYFYTVITTAQSSISLTPDQDNTLPTCKDNDQPTQTGHWTEFTTRNDEETYLCTVISTAQELPFLRDSGGHTLLTCDDDGWSRQPWPWTESALRMGRRTYLYSSLPWTNYASGSTNVDDRTTTKLDIGQFHCVEYVCTTRCYGHQLPSLSSKNNHCPSLHQSNLHHRVSMNTSTSKDDQQCPGRSD